MKNAINSKLIDAATEIFACGLNGSSKKQYVSSEKLIEVTVQECIRVIDDCVRHYRPASTYSSELAQHFGIKEYENKS